MKNILLITLFSLLVNNAYAAKDEESAEKTATDSIAATSDSEAANTGDEKVQRSTPNPKKELELDLAAHLKNSLTQVIKLTALEKEFDIYYMAADDKEPLGNVLFFPDERLHSDSPISLNTLRVGLTRHKWQTAVITLPLPSLAPIPKRTEYDNKAETETEDNSDDTAEDSAETAKTQSTENQTSTDTNDSAAQADKSMVEEEEQLPTETMAETIAARAEATVKLLKEKADPIIITGIGQGATWATAFALTVSAADKDKYRLLLINPLQSEDISAPKLTEMISKLTIDTFDIFTPHNPNFSTGINQPLARKRAANLSEIDQYLQIKATSMTWNKQGNNWLLRKVRGVLKKYVEMQLMAEKEKKEKPKKAVKMNQKPGAANN